MTDIERAIKDFEHFKEMGYTHSCLPSSWSIEVALAALREKQERDKGCEHCRGWDSRCGANYCPMCGRRLEVEHE